MLHCTKLYSAALYYAVQVLARSSPDDKHILVCRLNGHALPSNEQDWLLAHPSCDWKDRDNILPGYLQEWQQARSASGTVRCTLRTAVRTYTCTHCQLSPLFLPLLPPLPFSLTSLHPILIHSSFP